MGQGYLYELLPGGLGAGFPALQIDDPGPRGAGKFLVRLVALGGQSIEVFEIAEAGVGGPFRFKLHQQLAELRSPVADMILADDRVAQVLQQPRHGIADDGAAQVPHVHLLGEIGRGVINDDPLRMGLDRA